MENSHHHLKQSLLASIKWEPPPTGWIKLNFDGLVHNEVATTGFVSRNWDGHVMLAGVKKIGQTSITVAECLALRDGLTYTVHKGWRKIMLKGDSKVIIDCVNQVAAPH
ncbi:hypothetical protein L3X38_037942 [Prunus dulcis]|uniref:RNase H type-1 domain-containing protein n=1 Tax=Prunus dulcis TaxID=3755 RepID=A0AAD4YR62_PRUDU|nr:hypothetical protein L3X38_037942 [Prunus dulcis]